MPKTDQNPLPEDRGSTPILAHISYKKISFSITKLNKNEPKVPEIVA